MTNLLTPDRLCFNRSDAYSASVESSFLEAHCTANEGIECVVLAHTDILARIVLGTSLSHDDVTGFSKLSAKKFES